MSKKGPLGWATSCAAVPCKCVGGLHHNVPSRCQMVASERVLPVLHLGLVLFACGVQRSVTKATLRLCSSKCMEIPRHFCGQPSGIGVLYIKEAPANTVYTAFSKTEFRQGSKKAPIELEGNCPAETRKSPSRICLRCRKTAASS